MPLRLKPHRIAYAAPAQAAAAAEDDQVAGEMLSRTFTPVGSSVRAHLIPQDPSTAYQKTGLELRRPFLLLLDLIDLDALGISVGGRVEWRTSDDNDVRMALRVAGPVQRREDGLSTDHAAVMLEAESLEPDVLAADA